MKKSGTKTNQMEGRHARNIKHLKQPDIITCGLNQQTVANTSDVQKINK